MTLEKRIIAFSKLGGFLKEFINNKSNIHNEFEYNKAFHLGLKHQIKLANESNGWFTKLNIHFALAGWANLLTTNNLKKWINDQIDESNPNPQIIALILAGNIPLVGFHDLLSVLISGHNALIKLSSNDKHILPYLTEILKQLEPDFTNKIKFTNEKLIDYDAVIATGSNNTARYFEYYFKNKPGIIRKNRNSVAILNGKESIQDLNNLTNDIFQYYGLGCRSVSKLFVPRGYNFDLLFNAIYEWREIINETKYSNNYDYNKAVYLMSEFDFLDNGFFMIKEDQSLSSPIASIFFEYYDDQSQLNSKLLQLDEHIQCVVSNNKEHINFGETQTPALWDYADQINTIEFLSRL